MTLYYYSETSFVRSGGFLIEPCQDAVDLQVETLAHKRKKLEASPCTHRHTHVLRVVTPTVVQAKQQEFKETIHSKTTHPEDKRSCSDVKHERAQTRRVHQMSLCDQFMTLVTLIHHGTVLSS